MNKINEQIKQIHELFKKRGDWDGLPSMAGGQSLGCTASKDAAKNAYIAGKLDLITEAIVDAMRAKRKNYKDFAKYRLDTANFNGAYSIHTKNTYQDHLALARIRTMDLMGFYGVEFFECRVDSEDQVDNLLRQATTTAAMSALLSSSNSLITAKRALSEVVTIIIRIAELDKIDLQWHVDARLKYMESEV